MTVVPAGGDGLAQAGRVLDAGVPVVVPLPTPLPYVVAGTDAAAVNEIKGRPAGQPCGMVVADLSLVAPYVELDADTLAFARWLSAHELLNLLLPIGESAPGWLAPSTSKGWLGAMLGWLDPLRPLLRGREHLYLSSANRTGGEVAVTAGTADTAFAGRLLVVDGDPYRDQAVASGSATMIRVQPHRQVEVVRHGVNDAGFAADPGRFPHELARRWETSRRS